MLPDPHGEQSRDQEGTVVVVTSESAELVHQTDTPLLEALTWTVNPRVNNNGMLMQNSSSLRFRWGQR